MSTAIITGASSLQMAMPTTAPTVLPKLRSTSNGPTCRAMTPPMKNVDEIRCYMRDPDGYLIEVGQSIAVDDDG